MAFMAKDKTIFQRLTDVMIGTGNTNQPKRVISNYYMNSSNNVMYSFDNKEERDLKLKQLKQEKLLAYQWRKIGYDTSMEQMNGATQVRIMYRDADLMDCWPEIGAALDIYSSEATTLNKDNKMLNVNSKSDRIVSVLEDLFENRLDIHVMLPMIVRSLCKYGNEFMFLNMSAENGVMGWRELPVHEIRRIENGMLNVYGGNYTASATNLKSDEVKFVWEGHNESQPYKMWQIAHFRMIKDSLLLPYGMSILNKARRAWRMLSMMEDGMLLYRLERSIERRIFKVNVGLIDDVDVPQFLQDFMDNVKRAPIIDPQTGQIDLRRNFLDVSADYVIPVRNGQDPTSIETLQPAQNQTSMEDIQYMQNKILAALQVPKTFLNFQEAQGKGQNLSLMDIRFNRAINTVQQAVLMELTKIAVVHLYLLGFTDDLTNFTLSMNNPSNQLETMELDNQAKRLQNASAALSEQGGGIPLMSWHRVQKDIMGLTDSEISDMLNEIRLETAIANELQLTPYIIKNTNVFKQVDRIYGEHGAEYPNQPAEGGQQGGAMMGGGGGMPMPMGGGPDFGDELGDLGEPGAEAEGDIGGIEGGTDLDSMSGGNPLMENKRRLLKNLNEYISYINRDNEDKKMKQRPSIIDKSLMINEGITNSLKDLNEIKINQELIKE
jgi:hypothetical protein